MEYSIWYNEQIERIDYIIENFTKAEFSKYKLGLLKRIIRKVDQFQESCATCRESTKIIETLILEISDHLNEKMTFSFKQYNEQIKSIYKHLIKEHRVVYERHYIHTGIVIGVIFGLPFTLAFMSINPIIEKNGLWICVIIGLIIGQQLDKKASAEGRVLL